MLVAGLRCGAAGMSGDTIAVMSRRSGGLPVIWAGRWMGPLGNRETTVLDRDVCHRIIVPQPGFASLMLITSC